MLCHLVIPALLPSNDRVEEFLAGAASPALSLLLGRGSVAQLPVENYDAWLCRHFGMAKQQDWPLAPITLTADGGQPGIAYWLRADPVHLQVNRDQLILGDSSTFAISAAEADSFITALNTHFAERAHFKAPHPQRWYLRLPEAVDLQCTPLSEAAGKNIDPLLPKGAAARHFRSLFNEVQMLLFSHPLNEKRESEGQAMVNSVWLWGGGVMPRLPTPFSTKLWANENVARSLALASPTPAADLPANANAWLTDAKEPSEHLIVLDQLRAAWQYGNSVDWQQALQNLERDWFAPVAAALKSGRIGELRLTGFGEAQALNARATRADLWKFWRAVRPLPGLLSG